MDPAAPTQLASDGWSWERILSGQAGVAAGFILSGLILWKFVLPFIRTQLDQYREEIRRISESMDRMSRSVSALILGNPHYTQGSKAEAQAVINELDSQKTKS